LDKKENKMGTAAIHYVLVS